MLENLLTIISCNSKNWFSLVWFYSISTIVSYLMPNPFYTYTFYIYYMYDFKTLFVDTQS